MSFYHSSAREPLIALLVDQELHSRQRLSRLLREIAPEFTGIAEASTEEEAIKKIERFSPNLIFTACPFGTQLHTIMLEGTAQHVPKVIVCKQPDRVESTISEFGGYYLTKPVDAQHLRDLLDALNKSSANGNGKHAAANGGSAVASSSLRYANGHSRQSSSNGVSKHAYLNRLVVRRQGRFRLLPVDRVLWFGTEFRLVYAYTEMRRYPIDLGLDQLERRLDPKGFARIHRSAIVNISKIKEIVPISGGRSKVMLEDSQERTLPLSASRSKALRDLLKHKVVTPQSKKD